MTYCIKMPNTNINGNLYNTCLAVPTAFSETGQTDWMSYWGEGWGEGGFECEYDTTTFKYYTTMVAPP